MTSALLLTPVTTVLFTRNRRPSWWRERRSSSSGSVSKVRCRFIRRRAASEEAPGTPGLARRDCQVRAFFGGFILVIDSRRSRTCRSGAPATLAPRGRRTQAAALVRSLSRCARTAGRNPSGKRSRLFSVLFRKPSVARAESGETGNCRKLASEGRGKRTGHPDTRDTKIRPSTHQPASGQGPRLNGLSFVWSYRPGIARHDPSHSETGTLTAFPTSFHLGPLRRAASSTAGAVQSMGKPWSRSASRMSGVTISPVSRNHIAGGDGIPTVDPPFSVGTASTAQPRPLIPSVQ